MLLGIVVAYWGVDAFIGNLHLKQMSEDRGQVSESENLAGEGRVILCSFYRSRV